MLKHIILVGIGGAAGSMLRFFTGMIVSRFYTGNFPLGTFLINVIGCFFIGLLMGKIAATPNDTMKFLLITGFCGGYTTFSAFSFENIELLSSGHAATGMLYITASILAGIGAVWLGSMVA